MAESLPVSPRVRDLLERLHGAGHEAFIVGGAVRDLLLGREPKDYDIATSATPEEVRRVFGRAAHIIGRRFRLAHVYHGRTYYEVSTFRREPTPEERRTRETDDGVMIWQDNQFGTLEQDGARRDFTVNAIYYNPRGEPAFRDFCGGMQDLRSGVVRAIGDPSVRLAEDPVRVLRALKLVAEYDFRLDDSLAGPVRESASSIVHSSTTRLYEELLKIARKPYTARTFSVFHEQGLLAHYLPAMAQLWDLPGYGDLLRRLLAERDRRFVAPNYSRSRALALATAALPQVLAALDVPAGELWEHDEGIEKTIRETVRTYYSPLPVPRVLSARARDILLLLPRFRSPAHRKRLLHNPEYRYARELYSLLTRVCDWDPAVIDPWPIFGDYVPEPHGLRQKHMHRSHHKEWEES